MDETRWLWELARLREAFGWDQFWLVATTATLVMGLGLMSWTVGNYLLATRGPGWAYDVLGTTPAPWWRRLPWVARRARLLRDQGFVERGALIERLGAMKVRKWMFWSPAHQTWAAIHLEWVLVWTMLYSRLPDATWLVTGTMPGRSSRLRVREFAGTLPERLASHLSSRQALLQDMALTQRSVPDNGTLVDAVSAVRETHRLSYSPGADEPPASQDLPPGGVTVHVELHHVAAVFPYQLPRGLWSLIVVWPTALAALAMTRPLPGWVPADGHLVVFLLYLGSLAAIVLVSRWVAGWPTVWITPHQVAWQWGRWGSAVQLSDLEEVWVENRHLVLDARSEGGRRTLRWRVGRHAVQTQWLAGLVAQARDTHVGTSSRNQYADVAQVPATLLHLRQRPASGTADESS